MNKTVNYNGKDMLLSPMEVDLLHRTISIGEVTEEVATVVNSILRNLRRDSDDDITIYIQGPGGSVSAGLSIYDTVKTLGCDVVTVACGMTASMCAFLLAAAGTKGKRWCQPNAKILIHQPLGGISGQATDIRIHAQDIIDTRAKLNNILAQCTGKSPERIEMDTERDYIMNAQEAQEYGLIDKIGDPIMEEV